MGYLANTFGEFRVSSGHRLAAEYYLGDFIRGLSYKDRKELIALDAKLAVASGVFDRIQQYEAFRDDSVVDSYDFTVIGNLLSEMLLGDACGGSELMDEFLKRLEPSLATPEYGGPRMVGANDLPDCRWSGSPMTE